MVHNHQITVLFLANYLGVGGAEQQLVELVSNIDKTRFCPIVAVLYPGGALDTEISKVPGAELISLNRRGKYDFFTLIKVLRLLRRKEVDIIQPFLTPATFFGMLPALINRTPVTIVTERCGLRENVSWGNNAYRAVEDFLTRFSTVVVPNSESGKSYLLNRGIEPSRIKVIYNGINLDRLTYDPKKVDQMRSEMNLPPDGKVVGIVARLHPAKDQFTFLKAAKLVLQAIPDARFAIVGDGVLRTELENFAHELGITSETTFFGYQRDVGSYISTFDVACLCSIDLEGCSNATLEAMALGKPVVITDVGGNRELVNDGKNGFLIPTQSAEILADRIITCINQPERSNKMGQQAKETIHTRFSLERMVNDYEELYEHTMHVINEE